MALAAGGWAAGPWERGRSRGKGKISLCVSACVCLLIIMLICLQMLATKCIQTPKLYKCSYRIKPESFKRGICYSILVCSMSSVLELYYIYISYLQNVKKNFPDSLKQKLNFLTLISMFSTVGCVTVCSLCCTLFSRVSF